MPNPHAQFDEATGLYKPNGWYSVAQGYDDLDSLGYVALWTGGSDPCVDVFDPVTGEILGVDPQLGSIGLKLGLKNPTDPESHRKRIFEAGKWPQGPTVYKGFVKVEKLPVGTLGAQFPLEVVRVSNSVAFLVYNKTKDELLFAIQNRAPMMNHENPNGTILEVGAGRFDIKIGVKGLVVKELFEELGVTATEDEVVVLNNGVPLALSPGVLTEKQYLAYVEITDDRIDKSKKLYGNREEGEKIARRFIPASQFRSNSADPAIQIEDMKTWTLIQWFLLAEERNSTQRREFVLGTRSRLGYIGSGVDQPSRPQVIMVDDSGKDLDDEQAIILAAGLHHSEIINLLAVIANLDPALDRAKLTRGTLNELDLFKVRVGIGTPVFVGGKTEKHECDADYASGSNLHDGQQLLRDVLLNANPKSITWVLNSGLTDAALCFLSNPALFVEKTKEVVIMGGVRSIKEQFSCIPGRPDLEGPLYLLGPDKVNYMVPDTAANNAYDWPSALFLYQALQELKVPMCVVMRWMPYACQFPFSLYDKFAATGNPIGVNLLRRQAPSINLLWKAANVTQEDMTDPARAALRGKLPMDRNRQWFVNVFCKGVDPGIGPTDEVWSYVGDYNQYDAMALAMVVPEIRSRYTIPVQVEVKGVQHQIIGIAKEQPGLKDGDGLRNLIAEIEIGALSWKE